MPTKCAFVLLRCVFLFVAATIGVCAQPITINLDPSKTQIEFTLGDVLHTVHGTFKLTSGRLEVNPGTRAIAGQVVVDAASGESGNAARDSRMRKNILESDRYPEITFTATGMQGDLALTAPMSSITVEGWFQIHGQRHQISVPMQIQISGAEATAKGRFVVPYVGWGMKNPSTFILRVNQQVDIDVTTVIPGLLPVR
jgi:polyisoprenoid-binding protein YceI